jgi:hypothetical protein
LYNLLEVLPKVPARSASPGSSRAKSLDKIEGLPVRCDIVHAYDICRTGARKRDRKCYGRWVPLGRRTASQCPDEGLARVPDYNRSAKCAERGGTAQKLQVVFNGLAKADARINRDVPCGNALCAAEGNAIAQVAKDLAGNIGVLGVALHGAGLAAHVHEYQASPVRCYYPCHVVRK